MQWPRSRPIAVAERQGGPQNWIGMALSSEERLVVRRALSELKLRHSSVPAFDIDAFPLMSRTSAAQPLPSSPLARQGIFE